MPLTSNTKYMIFAIGAGLSVFFLFLLVVFKYNGQGAAQDDDLVAKPKIEYVYFAKDIKKGATIKEEDIVVKESKVELDGAYKSKAEVLGQVTSKDVTADKPVMKVFLKQKKTSVPGEEPANGFRAIPILVRKASMPPYLETGQKFDLVTKENDLKIENLKILNVLEPTKNDVNKMILLEVKNSDVPAFVKHQITTAGFVFLQKNQNEYGEYKFTEKNIKKDLKPVYEDIPSKMPDNFYIPSISNIPSIPTDASLKEDESKIPNNDIFDYGNTKEVEVIIGDQKTKVEFKE